jgi:NAD(P)-dependent dehydrogenase (short-subunit alcohol dehydrogenase family)
VLVADIDDAGGQALAAELGPALRFQHTDLAVEAEVEACVAAAQAHFGRIDFVVNVAAVADQGPAPRATNGPAPSPST